MFDLNKKMPFYKRPRMEYLLRGLLILGFLRLCSNGYGYEPTQTLPIMTAYAAQRANLHTILKNQWGLPDGMDTMLSVPQKDIEDYIKNVSPADFARPLCNSGLCKNTVAGWLLMGTYVSQSGINLFKNQFYNPTTKKGLRLRSEHPISDGIRLGIIDYNNVSSDGSNWNQGISAIDWIVENNQNPFSLKKMQHHGFVGHTEPIKENRNAALVFFFLSAGSVLGTIFQLGDPHHVSNDFLGAIAEEGYAEFVKQYFGQALPKKMITSAREIGIGPADSIPTMAHRLAEFTAKNFFSTTMASNFKPSRQSIIVDNYLLVNNKVRLAQQGNRFVLDRACYVHYANELIPLASEVGSLVLLNLFQNAISVYKNDNVAYVWSTGSIGGEVSLFEDNGSLVVKIYGTTKFEEKTNGSLITSYSLPINQSRYFVVVEDKNVIGESRISVHYLK